MKPASVHLALFDRATDNRPKAADMTLQELQELLTKHDVRPAKDGRLFSPTIYRPKKPRGNANVVALTLAVGDFDDGVQPERIRDHLASKGLWFAIHSTHSSTPTHPKFRAIVLLANPIPAGEWGGVWPALVRELFLGHVDLGTRDAARIFYLPSAPPGSLPFVFHQDGVAFDVSRLKIDPAQRRRPLTLPGETGPIVRGERRPKLVSIAGRLRNAGAGYDAILAEIREVNATRCDPRLAELDLEHIAGSVCRYPAGTPKEGGSPKTAEISPQLEEFDQDQGELFATTTESGSPDLGVAWVTDGRIHRTTISAELHRIAAEFDAAKKTTRENTEEAEAERARKTKRFLGSLPFTRVQDALWPLGDDPTTISVEQWERTHGSLFDALVAYFGARVTTRDPDGPVVLALWVMAAAARAQEIDFAPRILFEAPFGWGKSTGGEALVLVVPRAVSGASMTAAAVYRMMNGSHPVLLVDESAVADNPDLLRVLRAGFKRGAKIIRAAQNRDTGVVLVDPFGFVILTTQVDAKEDLVSRCFVVYLRPGRPAKRVTIRDQEAAELRTLLVRLRLEIRAGTAYPDFGVVAEQAHAADGLEPRSRDKLLPLWPFAVHYDVQDRLIAVASRLEQDSTEQLAGSDKGLVVAAIAAVVDGAGGLAKLRAGELKLTRVQEELERILVEEGEVVRIPVGGGETVARVDLKRFGPRDFTGRIVRELGLSIHTVKGSARLDLRTFIALWPSVHARYGGAGTLEDHTERERASSPEHPYTPPLKSSSSAEDLAGRNPYPTPTLGEGTPPQGGVGVGMEGTHPELPGEPPDGVSALSRVRLAEAVTAARDVIREHSGGVGGDEIVEALAAKGFDRGDAQAAIGRLAGSGVVAVHGDIFVLK